MKKSSLKKQAVRSLSIWFPGGDKKSSGGWACFGGVGVVQRGITSQWRWTPLASALYRSRVKRLSVTPGKPS
jgi:hypothetical protein